MLVYSHIGVFIAAGKVSGHLYNDANVNDHFDSANGEKGIAGKEVTVTVTTILTTGSHDHYLQEVSAVTDANGYFLVQNLYYGVVDAVTYAKVCYHYGPDNSLSVCNIDTVGAPFDGDLTDADVGFHETGEHSKQAGCEVLHAVHGDASHVGTSAATVQQSF